jgi:glucose/arabinose dehydrogenase
MRRSGASYLGVILAAVLSLHGCGKGGSSPPAESRIESCPEIFASGFRNPWRWSFDRQTGDLWVGDVGQGAREEINRVVLGGNYGWRCFEGTQFNPQGQPCGSEPNLLPPVAEYGRSVGTTVTGGYVYRGTAIANLAGRYVFGDFGSTQIWHIDANTPPTMQMAGGINSMLSIASFAEDNDGELYVVHYGGQLYRLIGPVATLDVEQVFEDLNPSFASPVAMLQAPNDSTRWFVVEQQGRVRVFDNDPLVTTFATFLDISARVASGGEMGLLGMAFHPAFATNGRVYLHYTNTTAGRVSRISEFTLADGGLTLDPSSERILLVIGQPEANHNGGHLAFGPDGHLYIGMGDGGGGNDQHGAIGNGQRMTTLLGKMLRIDVNGAAPYAIPASNPFAGFAPCGPNA